MTRFDIQEEQYAFLQEFFSRDEIEAANEEMDSTANIYDLNPISDTEEDKVMQESGDKNGAQQAHISNDEADPPLPESEEGSTQMHTLVRAQKRLRQDDENWAYYQLYIKDQSVYSKLRPIDIDPKLAQDYIKYAVMLLPVFALFVDPYGFRWGPMGYPSRPKTQPLAAT